MPATTFFCRNTQNQLLGLSSLRSDHAGWCSGSSAETWRGSRSRGTHSGRATKVGPSTSSGRLASSWYPSGRVNTRAVDCAPLRPCWMVPAPPPKRWWNAACAARIHIQCCPRPTAFPASGIFASGIMDESGWLTSFQPENPQLRVRRATCSRYVTLRMVPHRSKRTLFPLHLTEVRDPIVATNSGASQLPHSFPEARKPSFLEVVS